MFTTCFELKYASDELDTVNNAYANYYFYRYQFNYGGYEDPREIVFGSNKNGFVEKIDTATESLNSIDGLHIAVSITDSALKVCDTLDSWDADGCSESEYSLVQRSGDGMHTLWHQCFADKAFFDFFGIPRIASGRFFSVDEYKLSYEDGSTVPVVLGYDFTKYCEIGDTFDAVINTDTNETVKISIIGFIADGETFVDNNGSTLLSFNRVAVVPFCNRHYYEYTPRMTAELGEVYLMYSLDYRNKYLLVEKNRKTEVLEKMNDILEENGVSGFVGFIRSAHDTISIANNYRENMEIRLALTGITVLFSFVSVVLMTVNRMSANIRDYAIHLINGGTYGNVYAYVAGEIIVYSMFGFMIGSNAYGIRNIALNYTGNMASESRYGFLHGWFLCFCMLLIFMVICIAAAYFRIKKTDISSVIGNRVSSGGNRGTVYKTITVISFAVVSFCIVSSVSYFVYINNIDIYYRHFYTANTKKVFVTNDPSIGDDSDISPKYRQLAEDYVIDKFVSVTYTDDAPYIRGTYYEGNVALPDIIEGRYFSDEELRKGSCSKVVVMGRKAFDDFATVRSDGTAFFDYLNTEYEVIGITGKPDGTETRLDEWVFMPIDTALKSFGTTGTYFIDGKTKHNVEDACKAFSDALENSALVESVYQTLTEVVIGPNDALFSLAAMLIINIIIVCMYYVDRIKHIFSVKKLLGYDRLMVFADFFTDFLKLAFAGFFFGICIVSVIILTPLGTYTLFSSLSLNLLTVILSLLLIVCLALLFTVFVFNRMYTHDTSEYLRG